jgi:hypothetical protein
VLLSIDKGASYVGKPHANFGYIPQSPEQRNMPSKHLTVTWLLSQRGRTT